MRALNRLLPKCCVAFSLLFILNFSYRPIYTVFGCIYTLSHLSGEYRRVCVYINDIYAVNVQWRRRDLVRGGARNFLRENNLRVTHKMLGNSCSKQ